MIRVATSEDLAAALRAGAPHIEVAAHLDLRNLTADVFRDQNSQDTVLLLPQLPLTTDTVSITVRTLLVARLACCRRG